MGHNVIIHHNNYAVLTARRGESRDIMKRIIKTTRNMSSKLDELRLTRANTISITNKTMTEMSISEIKLGALNSLTLFETDTEEGTAVQAVFETTGAYYSTCSKVVTDFVNDIIDLINNGEVSTAELAVTFNISTSRNGNNFLAMNI